MKRRAVGGCGKGQEVLSRGKREGGFLLRFMKKSLVRRAEGKHAG